MSLLRRFLDGYKKAKQTIMADGDTIETAKHHHDIASGDIEPDHFTKGWKKACEDYLKEKEDQPSAAKKINKRPQNNKFILKPHLFPELCNSVLEVCWDQHGKKVSLEILETHDFQVVRWIELLQENKSSEPFDKDSVSLSFLDEAQKELASVLFKKLTLQNHSLHLSHDKCGIVAKDFIVHSVSISYECVEFTLRS